MIAAIDDRPATPQGQRERNRLALLQALHDHPGSSRQDLAGLTGLSRPTLTSLVDELEQAGLVARQVPEPEDRPRGSGRPAARLALAPRAGFAVGVDVGHDHVRAAVIDLAGALVGDAYARTEIDHRPQEGLDLAAELVDRALGEAGAARDHVVGVGLGIAAPVDAATKAVRSDGILAGWGGLRPAEDLAARLGLPVQVENDANAGALGEHAFGAARDAGDVLYVRLAAGIGLGLILDGRAYRGSSGLAGELGHVQVVPDGGLDCRCGKRGCLETVATPRAVAERLGTARGRATSVEALLEFATTGDAEAAAAVGEAGAAIGRALAAVVNVLNPALIVVGGDLSAAADHLLPPLRQAMARDAVAPAAEAVRIVTGTLGARAEVLGAAGMMLAAAPVALLDRGAANLSVG